MGTPEPQGNFDFFLCKLDGHRASILVDLSLIDQAPIEGLPMVVAVQVSMQQPRPDGLRSAEEAEALFALEDAIIGPVSEGIGLRYVGRIVTNGRTDLTFYGPPDVKARGAQLLRLIEGARGSYKAEVLLHPDAEWRHYREVMYPGIRDLHRMSNRRLMMERRQHHDDESIAREIDHMAIFASPELAQQAAQKLGASGFRVSSQRSSDREGEVQHLVDFHRDEAPSAERMDAVVDEILDLIEPFDGEYDGWGAAIVTGEPSKPSGGFWRRLIGRA